MSYHQAEIVFMMTKFQGKERIIRYHQQLSYNRLQSHGKSKVHFINN